MRDPKLAHILVKAKYSPHLPPLTASQIMPLIFMSQIGFAQVKCDSQYCSFPNPAIFPIPPFFAIPESGGIGRVDCNNYNNRTSGGIGGFYCN